MSWLLTMAMVNSKLVIDHVAIMGNSGLLSDQIQWSIRPAIF